MPQQHVQQSIILTNGSRLLLNMLNRILLKTHQFDIVQQISDHKKLPSAIELFKDSDNFFGFTGEFYDIFRAWNHSSQK